MNAQNNSCDHKRIDAFLNSGHVALDDPQLIDHLDTCAACCNYIEAQAAEAERWAKVTELLKPTEFDQASTVGCSAATIGHQRNEHPFAVQNVLDSLAPSNDPNRLGLLGGYEVSGVVGVGGMGVVLKAVDPALDRVVAIKVMAPHLANNRTARRRFSREAKAAAAVLHPNVIPIHSVSSDDSIPYLVMAYIRGGSLQKRLQCEGPLTTVEILRIGSQVAAGLAAAHEQGLVHRDIKPENILLEDGVERVTLTDFGLARAVDDASVTREGTIAGTPQYMSPEQARGESVDQTSDLFSLGSVLYALCTGRPPFRAETSYGVMRRIIDESSVPIREINPEIPDWLAQIVEKLMAKDKAGRFDSAKEVHTLLESCLSHVQQPTHAELPDSLRAGLVTTQPQGGPKTFLTSRIVVLTMIGILAALGLIGINSLASRFALEEARKAFTQAQAELDSRTSTGNPTNAVVALLTNEHGPGYLLALDNQFKHFAYDKYLALDGKSEGAVFIWNRNNAHEPQMLIGTNGKWRLTGVLPHQIYVTELKIEQSKLLIGYTASDRAADRLTIETEFKLRPGASYETTVEITDLLRDNADWNEPFKHGRLVSSSNLQDEPISRLMRVADETGPASESAIVELLHREGEGLLNSDQMNDLIDLVLKHQADRQRPWRTEMGDLIEKSWVSDKLDRDLWEQYTAQFVVDYFDVKVRPRIVIGTPGGVNLQLVVQDVRCGSGKHITFQLQQKSWAVRIGETLIGASNMPGNLGTIRHKGGYSSLGCNNAFGQQTWESIKPGRQTITYESELAILESAAPENKERQDVFASRKVTFETETTFLPRGQTTVNINTDPSMKADVDRSITIKRIKTGPAVNPKTDNKYYSNVMLDITPRPIDIAFEIILKDGDNEYTSGSVTSTSDDKDGLNSMAYIPSDLSGKRIDVIFRPAPEIAEDTVDLFEIWGEEIVFKNVLVSGESVTESGK
jgi:serine/threonine-protein kinase